MPTAIVTGASRGFGRALADELAKQSWDLVINARTSLDLETAADGLRDEGSGEVVALTGDVADPGHTSDLVEAASSLGELSLLVNNASLLGPSPQPNLDVYPLDILRDVFEANVLGPLRLIQLALPQLRDNLGTVVNLTSDAAVESYPGWGGYGSSKAALEQLSNILAGEEPDVRVYWFDPGDMNTQMHQEAFPNEDISDRPSPDTRVPPLLRLLASTMPSGRYTASQLLVETMS